MIIDKLIHFNRQLSASVEKYLPYRGNNIFSSYEKIIVDFMNKHKGQIIVDLGAGSRTLFSRKRDTSDNFIIAVDISWDALRDNKDVDARVAAHVLEDLPFSNESIDLIVSRSFLEHLPDLEKFMRISNRVLKTKGLCIHLFPCKFAPFALINQLIPTFLSKKILYYLYPQAQGVGGFPAHYDKCYFSAIKSLFAHYNYQILESRFHYFQSSYFGFFFPFFLISVLYEWVTWTVDAKNLCSFLLIVARKE
jgi:ubiquinone/menaquinone biosynthesis C-methylase UbiE